MVIAFAGQKGGGGKTTTAIAVAAELVASGREVLLVDADQQGTARAWAYRAEQRGHPTPQTVQASKRELAAGTIGSLVPKFDFTIIDCPGADGEVQDAALLISDLVVLPCGPQAVDGWALAGSIERVKKAMRLRTNLSGHILITRKRRTKLGETAREVLQDAGLPILKTEFGMRDAYEAAPALGMGPVQYAPRDRAAEEVRALVAELTSLGEKRNGEAKTESRRSRPESAAANRDRG